MKKSIIGLMLAVAALFGVSTAANAKETSTSVSSAFQASNAEEASTPKKDTRSVIERVVMIRLVPGSPFMIDESQADHLVKFGCTFGPTGAFEVQLGPEESPCSKGAIKVKKKAVKAGGFVYDIRRVGTMFVYTIVDMGVSRNSNFKCQFNLLPNGQITENQCANTANGKMAFDALMTSFFAGTGQAVFGSIASNLTAPDAGDTNIQVGSNAESAATNNNTNNGGGGSGPTTLNINNNPQVAAVVTFNPNCPTSTCH